MAKKSSIEKNNRRRKMAKKFANRRAKLKAIAHDKKLPMEERFAATLKLAELPRNSSRTRIRNRCELSGRPRAYYRKHRSEPYRFARAWLQRPDPRPCEVELVGGRDGVNDPIGDMIARIRNAQMRSKSKVSMPGSKQRERVLEVLKTEGFIRGYASVAHASGRSELEIELKYFDGEPVIREIERISKPGRRVYVAVRNLPRINNGLGVAILSTPKGVMADHDAREANVGGEIICTVF